MLWTILMFLAAALAALLLYVATRPDAFRVERTIAIAAPPETVFPLIADLRAFNTWNPFSQQDTDLQVDYRGPPSGVGAGYDWKGKKAGAGSMDVTEAVVPAHVAMDLHFTKPMVANNIVVFTITPAQGGVHVTWAMTGTYGFIQKLFGLLFNMDKMVGGEFAKGLANLKRIAEGQES